MQPNALSETAVLYETTSQFTLARAFLIELERLDAERAAALRLAIPEAAAGAPSDAYWHSSAAGALIDEIEIALNVHAPAYLEFGAGGEAGVLVWGWWGCALEAMHDIRCGALACLDEFPGYTEQPAQLASEEHFAVLRDGELAVFARDSSTHSGWREVFSAPVPDEPRGGDHAA